LFKQYFLQTGCHSGQPTNQHDVSGHLQITFCRRFCRRCRVWSGRWVCQRLSRDSSRRCSGLRPYGLLPYCQSI